MYLDKSPQKVLVADAFRPASRDLGEEPGDEHSSLFVSMIKGKIILASGTLLAKTWRQLDGANGAGQLSFVGGPTSPQEVRTNPHGNVVKEPCVSELKTQTSSKVGERLLNTSRDEMRS